MSEQFDPRVPFRREVGIRHGIGRRALQGNGFRQLHRGCYVAAETTPSLATRAAAALEMVPGAYGLSHQSAAAWCGATAPDTPDIHLAVPHRLRCDLPGIRIHRYRKPPMLWTRRGVKLTAPPQTFVDLAATSDLVELVVLGDSLVRRTSVTPTELAAFARQSRANGIMRARRAITFVRSDVDSPQETRSRMLLVLAGLPEPTVDLRFYTDDGTLLRRMDLAYKDAKLAVEYDGRQHIERETQWANDIGRREYFEDLGWRFVVLISPDIWVTPGRTVERVHGCLIARGVKVPPLRDGWRLHFPGRGSCTTAHPA